MLDRAVSPTIRFGTHEFSTFQVCGVVGCFASLGVAIALAYVAQLSIWLVVSLWAAALLLFVVLALMTKVITGEETLVYYRHEVAILAMAAVIVRLVGKPLLPYLDVSVLAIGTFLIFGRLGCYAVGCCHGRPSFWGVRYRVQHAEQGFPRYLVGTRLTPVQLVEAVCVACIVIAGCVLLRRGPHGVVLVLYTLAYGVARFVFEFFRGDGARPHFRGLSEAQWWSLVLSFTALTGISSGSLPPVIPRQLAGAGALFICVTPFAFHRWSTSPLHGFDSPEHVAQLALALDAAAQAAVGTKPTPQPFVAPRTCLGIRVSAARHTSGEEILYHYTLSRQDGILQPASIRVLARLICRLRHGGAPYRLMVTRSGIVHVLIQEAYSPSTGVTTGLA